MATSDVLTALVIPVVITACVALVGVVAIGSGTSSPEDSTSSSRNSRRRHLKVRERQREAKRFRGSVPVEVLERIIDFVRNDKRTLKQCALTSRAWLPRVRYHLHRTFTVKVGGPDPYKLRSHPGVARCIRRLIIEDGLWNEVNKSVLPDLGYVESLQLGTSHTINKVPRSLTLAEFPRFPALKSLRIQQYVSFASKEELISVLDALRQLNSLYIDLAGAMHMGDWFEPPLSAPALPEPTFSLPLEILHLAVLAHPGPVPQELLAIAGTALKHFRILIVSLSANMQRAFDLLGSLSFAANTCLETFSVRFLWHDVLRPSPSELNKHLAPTFLARIHSPHLRTLSFRIVLPIEAQPLGQNNLWWLRYFNVVFLDGFANPEVNHALLTAEERERAVERSKGLQKFKLELDFTSRFPQKELELIVKHVEVQLPQLRQRKMLEVTCSE